MRLLASSADRAEHGDRVSLLIDSTNMASTRWGPDSLLRLPVVDGGFIKEDDLPTIPHELGELYCELGSLLLYLRSLESALPPSLLRGPELDLVGLIEQGEDILGDGDAELLLDGNGPLLNGQMTPILQHVGVNQLSLELSGQHLEAGPNGLLPDGEV